MVRGQRSGVRGQRSVVSCQLPVVSYQLIRFFSHRFSHTDVLVYVGLGKLLRQFSQALFFPQACVLCNDWVFNTDFSSLCQNCFLSLEAHNRRICYYCGIQLPGNVLEIHGICSLCRTGENPFDFARSYGVYQGNLRSIIWKFKFEGCRSLARPLAILLETCFKNSGLQLEPAWIVPVPTHARRKRARGFDQTLLLSRALSRRLKIPLFTRLLRVKSTLPQSGLNLRERKENVRDAFALLQGDLLSDEDVLLVDDIMTTGITISQVCQLLRTETAVRTIFVLTVARVSLRYP
ncbi:ComF family protein [Acidobacteria bacterium AH-259-D05]|nr:ComF family protein [Acidobacteria bacterium AH-259-D05]